MSITRQSSTASIRSAERRARIAGLVVGIALFAALLVYLWRAIGAGDLALDLARPGPLAASMALLLAAYVAQAYAWHLLVWAAGGAQSAAVDGGRWSLSLLGKYVPGKIFNAVGRVALYRGSAPGAAGMAAAFVAESLLTLTAAACVATVALWLVRDGVPTLALTAAALFAAVGIVVSFSTLFDRAAGWAAAWVLHTAVPAPIARSRRIAPFAFQVASYLLMGGGLYAMTFAWQPMVPVPAAAVVGALCLSGIAGVLAFVVPAGIGVREGALVWVLAPYTGPAFAALIAVAARVWLTTGDAVAVALGAWLARGGAGERP